MGTPWPRARVYQQQHVTTENALPRVLLEEVPLELSRTCVLGAGANATLTACRACPAMRHALERTHLNLGTRGATIVDETGTGAAASSVRGYCRVRWLTSVLRRPQRGGSRVGWIRRGFWIVAVVRDKWVAGTVKDDDRHMICCARA